MKKIVWGVMVITLMLPASLLDFKYLQEAKEAYHDKNYSKAEALYGKVELDSAKFNRADALYRAKKYQEAINLYESIKEPSLQAQKLHNIGNAYAQMKKIDEAIASYEEALKIKEDKDTRFNLELLKKKKEEQKKKQQQNKDNKQNKNNKEQDKKNQKNQKENKQDNKKQNSKKNDKNSDKQDKKQNNQKGKDKNESDKKSKAEKEQEKKEQEEQKKREAKKQEMQKRKEEEKKQKGKMGEPKPVPISNMEERKWQKMLNQRGVNTLMIPLNKGEKKNETNPW